ncbi:Putative uncharacterized protein [Escherichia coli D6-117.29]|nr:Protein of unknown function [Escherichia coli]CDP78031.1 Putative uncharacterized protein [Escherichia coli D6-117.29]CDU38776.1 Protein of unknown function [Escherichia coli]
MSLTATPQA